MYIMYTVQLPLSQTCHCARARAVSCKLAGSENTVILSTSHTLGFYVQRKEFMCRKAAVETTVDKTKDVRCFLVRLVQRHFSAFNKIFSYHTYAS